MTFRLFLTAIVTTALLAGPALGHPGHLSDDGYGHTHWLALAAVAGVLVIGLAAWRNRGRTRREASRDRTV